ncbi:MAG: DUF4386 family protein [Chloroflexi bacterium]|nr:DUF4386 family protein [Chloroflexota bacterium]
MIASVLFTIGYCVVLVVPGAGDNHKEEDFTRFYGSDGKMLLAFLMGITLVAGALALVWFFNEVRSKLADDTLSHVGYTAAVIGASAAAIGGAILLAPIGVQQNSDSAFVGVAIAYTFDQAGLGVMLLVGMSSLALATALFSLTAGRARLLPSWAAWVGIVIAVVMLGSYIWLPGLLFPVWVLAFGMLLRSEPLAA